MKHTTTDLTWTSFGATHMGMVRKVNEDAMLDRPDAGLWAIADGMGGHAAGDVASRRIVEALAELRVQESLADMLSGAEDALAAVNDELLELAVTEHKRTIGSTVVGLILAQGHGICLWVGDSRLYRQRKGQLERITQDHAMVEEMVEVGLISRAQAETHPQANRITRAIGASDNLFVDLEIFRLQPGDRFVLCSDGLYKELSDRDINAVLGRSNGADTAELLVQQALERGARDNVSVVVVHIQNSRGNLSG